VGDGRVRLFAEQAAYRGFYGPLGPEVDVSALVREANL